MDKAIVEIIRRYRSALEKRGIGVDKMVLYGSHGTGTANEHSDIDLIVVSDDFADLDLWDRQCALGHALADVFEPIEALGYTVAEYEAMGPGTFVGQEVKPKGIEMT